MSKVVLCILAHPDDAEFLCAGTLARLSLEQGFKVHIATMTPGDCGSASLAPEVISEIRRKEGSEAAAILKGQYHCIEEKDLLVFYSQQPLLKVTHLIREVNPTIILTHSPSDYMMDHEQTSAIVRAAAFCAPIPNFDPSTSMKPIPHIPHLYYCDPIEGVDPMGKKVVPQFMIDITSTIETKAQMLTAHASQRDWLLKHHGMDQYLLSMRNFAAHQGKEIGVEAAEGFRQHLGHSYPQNNILGSLLGFKEVLKA